MATIVDHQIRELARMTGLVEPFNPDQINPASYDVTLGTTILKEGVGSEDRWIPVDITGGVYVMQPGEFVLAATEEMVRIPNNLECVFNLKSSRGREGFEHLMAGYIDPGFHGKITLELCNVNRHHRLALEPGMRIGQLRFSKLDAIPHRSYALTGRYHGDDGVRTSKG
jgi:dCTP deaminase